MVVIWTLRTYTKQRRVIYLIHIIERRWKSAITAQSNRNKPFENRKLTTPHVTNLVTGVGLDSDFLLFCFFCQFGKT